MTEQELRDWLTRVQESDEEAGLALPFEYMVPEILEPLLTPEIRAAYVAELTAEIEAYIKAPLAEFLGSA